MKEWLASLVEHLTVQHVAFSATTNYSTSHTSERPASSRLLHPTTHDSAAAVTTDPAAVCCLRNTTEPALPVLGGLNVICSKDKPRTPFAPPALNLSAAPPWAVGISYSWNTARYSALNPRIVSAPPLTFDWICANTRICKFGWYKFLLGGEMGNSGCIPMSRPLARTFPFFFISLPLSFLLP